VRGRSPWAQMVEPDSREVGVRRQRPCEAIPRPQALQSVAVRSFVLQAVPQGAQSGDRCGTLRLDNVGAKTAALDSCWVR